MRESSESELVSHLISFLVGCPMSVFVQRFLFLWHLVHTVRKSLPERLRRELVGLLEHFAELGWRVEARILEERKAAEGPMKEIQKIMTWYFEDLVNLQMNVEKLYRGVNRCLRLQEDALSRTVEAVVISEVKAAFREKTTDGLIARLKRDGMASARKQKQFSHVKKEQFEAMVRVMGGAAQSELFLAHFRSMRHVSIAKLVTCLGLSCGHRWIRGQIEDAGQADARVKLIRQVRKQRPRFKNYFNAKYCLREYIGQTLEGVERVRDKKKKFKARFMLDFVKGFCSIFEVKSGLNVNSLSKMQVRRLGLTEDPQKRREGVTGGTTHGVFQRQRLSRGSRIATREVAEKKRNGESEDVRGERVAGTGAGGKVSHARRSQRQCPVQVAESDVLAESRVHAACDFGE